MARQPEAHSRGHGVPRSRDQSDGRIAVAGPEICPGTGVYLPRDGSVRMSAPGPGQLLFNFVRHWSRRAGAEDASIAEQGRLVLVTEAVNSLVTRDETATVNAGGQELGIDQSGASRLIGSAAGAGYLTMTKGSADGGRRVVSVTAVGRRALQQAHAWQEEIFAELTVGWNQQRRDDFESAMADLIARSYAIGA